jgi:uncharacterized protein (TIGR03083 family)
MSGKFVNVSELSMERYADVLLDQTEQCAVLLAGADLSRQVPSCPEWDLRQLVEHIGQAHRFGAEMVRRRVREAGEVKAPTDIPVPEDPDALGGWLAAGARELVEAVRGVGAEQPVWNYLGVDQRAGFWLRRMANETAVHRVDVALTVGAPFALDADLAADAISEWLTLITSPGAAAHRPELAQELRGHGQTLHLHATDSPSLGESGEWLIRRGPETLSWEHGHHKADVAVRGLAADLLLALLGRIPIDDGRLETIGEAALFEHWVQHVTF